jgi:RimJ/RimL family protein N-acetyltransferase
MVPSRSQRIQTHRLLLRATEPGDAGRAYQIQSNWNVTRNLRMAAFPPDRREMIQWFAVHGTEWLQGTAFRFAIQQQDRMIGLIDVDEISDHEGELGYWLDEAYWGQGFALEAARAVAQFAFEQAGLNVLRSGHAADNPASGRVLTKLGFRHIDDVTIPSRARGGHITQRRYSLAPSASA